MMQLEIKDAGVHVNLFGRDFAVTVSPERSAQFRRLARTVWQTPFTKRSWSELLFLVVSPPIASIGIVLVMITMAAGALFAVTFVGLVVIAFGVRCARGIGRYHRAIGRALLDEEIEEPEPFTPNRGVLGWLQSTLRDRTGWRSIAYILVKVPLTALAIFTAFSVWWSALACLAYPVFWRDGDGPAVFGLPRAFWNSDFLFGSGFFHYVVVFVTGVVLFFIAPWLTRVVVYLDRFCMRALLAPDSTTVRLRSLEHARTQTVEASAATLRRIERDLHDGTQAQLVALAMRLGMVKEKLADDGDLDLDRVRQLVDDAHRGAKEAIVELRDLARGIHPPALDTGLASALTTLAARCTVPTELTLALEDRPTPAIEAIAYFCVAELLANIAQHAHASRASVTCSGHAGWLRVVVRDDGTGGAAPSRLGSSSSGLVGLTDRVHAVDGRLDIDSPPRGPTVITVDLPLHA